MLFDIVQNIDLISFDIVWKLEHCSKYCSILLLQFFSALFMTLPHIVQNCSKHCSMSNISRLMRQWWLLHHCLTASPGRYSEQPLHGASWQYCWPCQLCQFLCLLHSDHSAQLLRFAIADVMILLLFHFDSLWRLECEGYSIAQST